MLILLLLIFNTMLVIDLIMATSTTSTCQIADFIMTLSLMKTN